MDEKGSRRQFLRWLGASSGALILTNLGCSSPSQAGNGESDAGHDTYESGDGGLDGEICELTGSDVRGPFYEPGAPQRTVLAGAEEPGERMIIEGTVYGPDCETPVVGALLDIWQADQEGDYHGAGQDYRLRGQMLTDEEGRYQFETIRPGHYPLGGSMRPAHIHYTVTAPGYRSLTTQLYFSGDPYLSPNDPCGTGCNSGDETLIIDLEERQQGSPWQGTFDIILAQE